MCSVLFFKCAVLFFRYAVLCCWTPCYLKILSEYTGTIFQHQVVTVFRISSNLVQKAFSCEKKTHQFKNFNINKILICFLIWKYINHFLNYFVFWIIYVFFFFSRALYSASWYHFSSHSVYFSSRPCHF